MAHMVVWYLILQFSLMFLSGAVGWTPRDDQQQATKLNLLSFSVLIAHSSGFASINAWGQVQHLEYFAQNWYMSLLPVPIAIVGQLFLQAVMSFVRNRIALGDDGKVDQFEEMWNDATEEAETDIMGLATSFLFIQSLRYLLTNHLPTLTGEDEGDVSVSSWHCYILLGCAALFGFLLFLVQIIAPDRLKEEEEKDSDSEEEENQNPETQEEEEPKPVGYCLCIGRRLFKDGVTVLGMMMAWCYFYSAKWGWALIGYENHEMLGAVVVALGVSFTLFATIRLLDILADASWTGREVDDAIKTVIFSIGLCIGFSWEQSFDKATSVLTAVAPSQPQFWKLGLAIFLNILVVPAWRWWLLPMVVEKGWKFGFVASHLDPKAKVKISSLGYEKLDAGEKSKLEGQIKELQSKNKDLDTAFDKVFKNCNSHMQFMQSLLSEEEVAHRC